MHRNVHVFRETIAALTPVGMVSAPLRFFEPTGAFMEWMDSYHGRLIYDVGAGVGHVAAALRQRGHTVVALDMARRPSVSPVMIANALTFPYRAGSLVLFCRPCHGPFFVQPTIDWAMQRGVSPIVYVGFAKNVASDTGRYRRHFRLAATKVGEAGERLYVKGPR